LLKVRAGNRSFPISGNFYQQIAKLNGRRGSLFLRKTLASASLDRSGAFLDSTAGRSA
jgi:hypothetical protein